MSDNVKENIKSTLLELSSRVDIEKINVSMLVKACGISRTLFYYYYQDIFAVLEDILSTQIGKLITECIKIEDPKESIRHFVWVYSQQFHFLKKIRRTRYYEEAEKMIAQAIRKYFRIILNHKAAGIAISPDEAEFHIDFMSNGMTMYFFQHCEDDSFDIEKVSGQFYRMTARFFEPDLLRL